MSDAIGIVCAHMQAGRCATCQEVIRLTTKVMDNLVKFAELKAQYLRTEAALQECEEQRDAWIDVTLKDVYLSEQAKKKYDAELEEILNGK